MIFPPSNFLNFSVGGGRWGTRKTFVTITLVSLTDCIIEPIVFNLLRTRQNRGYLAKNLLVKSRSTITTINYAFWLNSLEEYNFSMVVDLVLITKP